MKKKVVEEIKTEQEAPSYEVTVKQTASQIIGAAASLAAMYNKKLNKVLDDFAEGVNELTKD